MIEAILMLFGEAIMIFGGALGILRFPDVYTRLHAATKCDTGGGAMSIILALVLTMDAPAVVRVKFLVLAFLIAMINPPMVSHAIARAAYRYGVKPEVVVDMYAWDNS